MNSKNTPDYQWYSHILFAFLQDRCASIINVNPTPLPSNVGCQIPFMDPRHPSIMRFISNTADPQCSGKKYGELVDGMLKFTGEGGREGERNGRRYEEEGVVRWKDERAIERERGMEAEKNGGRVKRRERNEEERNRRRDGEEGEWTDGRTRGEAGIQEWMEGREKNEGSRKRRE